MVSPSKSKPCETLAVGKEEVVGKKGSAEFSSPAVERKGDIGDEENSGGFRQSGNKSLSKGCLTIQGGIKMIKPSLGLFCRNRGLAFDVLKPGQKG